MTSIESETLSLLTSSRSLRGGSSSGSGGVSGSSGGGFSGGQNHNKRGTGSGSPLGTSAFLIIISSVVGFIFAIYCLSLCIMKCPKEKEKVGISTKFEETVSKVKQKIKEKARELKEGTDTPINGTYMISFSDRGNICRGSATLTFEDQGNGYNISGCIKDNDGTSEIEEGFASYNGNAYWKDKCIEGDVGLSVLSKGKFDYQTGIFTGKWVSNTGMRGVYCSFHPVESDSSQTIEQTLPLAVGQEVPEAEIVVEASTLPIYRDNTNEPVTSVGKLS